LAFLPIDAYSRLIKSLKYKSQNLHVVFKIARYNDNIIQIDEYMGFEIGTDDVIHDTLPGGRRIYQPEGHPPKLIKTTTGHRKRGIFSAIRGNLNLSKRTFYVNGTHIMAVS
jgi:hypothetical protein